MARIALIVSLLLLIGAAGLGFKTKELVEQKVAELKQTIATLNTTKSTLASTQKELKQTQENLVTANNTIKDRDSQITGLQGELAASKEETTKAMTTIAERDTKITEQEKMIADLQKPPEEGVKSTSPAMLALQDKINQLTTDLNTAKSERDAFQKDKARADEALVAAQVRIKRYEVPITQRGLTGRVMSVNPGWNFVVLNVGDKQGVAVNSPLLAMRGGQMVARLKITSVEPNSSIADVVNGTLPKGQALQPGDRVIFTGPRGEGPMADTTGGPASGGGAPPSSAPAPAPGLPQ